MHPRSSLWSITSALAFTFTSALAVVPGVAHAQGAPPPADQAPPPQQVQPPPEQVQPIVINAAPVPVQTPPPGYYPQPVPGYPPGYYPPQRIIGYRATTVPYEGGPIPPYGRVHTRRPLPLIIGGGGGFLLSYLASILVWDGAGYSCTYYSGGGSSCGFASLWMVVPVVGPWLALTEQATASRFGVFLVVDGIVQVGALALAFAGLAIKHRTLEIRQPVYGSRARPAAVQREWSLAPTAAPGALGLSVVGTF